MDCPIEGHRTKKVILQDKTMYLQGPREGQALLEPALSVHQLPAEMLMGDLWGMQQLLKAMITLFRKIVAETEEEKANNITIPYMSSLGPETRKLQNTKNCRIDRKQKLRWALCDTLEERLLTRGTDGLCQGEYPREQPPKLRKLVGDNVGEVCNGMERN
jgi:hypothetical protein